LVDECIGTAGRRVFPVVRIRLAIIGWRRCIRSGNLRLVSVLRMAHSVGLAVVGGGIALPWCCFLVMGRLGELELDRAAHVVELSFQFRGLVQQVSEWLALVAG